MIAEPSRDWNVFKQIFVDHLDWFKLVYPRYNKPYYDGLVDKMLGCGNPEKMGYIAYRCLHCGQGKHLVAMSCQSSLCLRCAKVGLDHGLGHPRGFCAGTNTVRPKVEGVRALRLPSCVAESGRYGDRGPKVYVPIENLSSCITLPIHFLLTAPGISVMGLFLSLVVCYAHPDIKRNQCSFVRC